MGFMTVNHEQAQQGRYMAPEGDYECVITEAKYDKTRGGTEYLHIVLQIRDDVAQEGRGETIDWPVWKKKQPTRNDPDGFALGTIQQISRVAQLPNGQDYPTIDDWMRALNHKPIKVQVKHETYNDHLNARVGFVYPTEHPEMSSSAQGFVEVNEEDLPF